MEEKKLYTEQDLNIEEWNKLLQYPRLGEILIQQKKLNIHQLVECLEEQNKEHFPLGQILLQKNIITKDELLEVLELQVGISKMLNESLDELKNTNS